MKDNEYEKELNELMIKLNEFRLRSMEEKKFDTFEVERFCQHVILTFVNKKSLPTKTIVKEILAGEVEDKEVILSCFTRLAGLFDYERFLLYWVNKMLTTNLYSRITINRLKEITSKVDLLQHVLKVNPFTYSKENIKLITKIQKELNGETPKDDYLELLKSRFERIRSIYLELSETQFRTVFRDSLGDVRQRCIFFLDRIVFKQISGREENEFLAVFERLNDEELKEFISGREYKTLGYVHTYRDEYDCGRDVETVRHFQLKCPCMEEYKVIMRRWSLLRFNECFSSTDDNKLNEIETEFLNRFVEFLYLSFDIKHLDIPLKVWIYDKFEPFENIMKTFTSLIDAQDSFEIRQSNKDFSW